MIVVEKAPEFKVDQGGFFKFAKNLFLLLFGKHLAHEVQKFIGVDVELVMQFFFQVVVAVEFIKRKPIKFDR